MRLPAGSVAFATAEALIRTFGSHSVMCKIGSDCPPVPPTWTDALSLIAGVTVAIAIGIGLSIRRW